MYINCGPVTCTWLSAKKKEKKTVTWGLPMWIVHVFPVPCSVLRPISPKTSVRLTADSELSVEYENL